MIEHIPEQIERAFLYFHSAGTTSTEIEPFWEQLIDGLPNTYLWAGDGVISRAPLMRQGLSYGDDPKRYWFTFPMQDACSPESFASHVEAMGATLACGGAYVNALADQVMARFQLTAGQVVLGGFQHGSCIALAAAMQRRADPYACAILFEPYILEAYYLKDEAPLPPTRVLCIDNQHIHQRTVGWIGDETAQVFQSYGMQTERITTEGGSDDLDSAMIDAAITTLRSGLTH